jgi:hypothetical protein
MGIKMTMTMEQLEAVTEALGSIEPPNWTAQETTRATSQEALSRIREQVTANEATPESVHEILKDERRKLYPTLLPDIHKLAEGISATFTDRGLSGFSVPDVQKTDYLLKVVAEGLPSWGATTGQSKPTPELIAELNDLDPNRKCMVAYYAERALGLGADITFACVQDPEKLTPEQTQKIDKIFNFIVKSLEARQKLLDYVLDSSVHLRKIAELTEGPQGFAGAGSLDVQADENISEQLEGILPPVVGKRGSVAQPPRTVRVPMKGQEGVPVPAWLAALQKTQSALDGRRL